MAREKARRRQRHASESARCACPDVELGIESGAQPVHFIAGKGGTPSAGENDIDGCTYT